jgi:hypothetical protein
MELTGWGRYPRFEWMFYGHFASVFGGSIVFAGSTRLRAY